MLQDNQMRFSIDSFFSSFLGSFLVFFGFSFILLISFLTQKDTQGNRDQTPSNQYRRQQKQQHQGKQGRAREREREIIIEERTGSHLPLMDPKVEMAFFTSSTLPAENLKTGETKEPLVGHGSFSRVSFLACT